MRIVLPVHSFKCVLTRTRYVTDCNVEHLAIFMRVCVSRLIMHTVIIVELHSLFDS